MSDCAHSSSSDPVLHAQIDALRIDGDVVRENPAAEAAEDARDNRADLAGADDPDRAAVHVEPEQSVQRKVAFAHARVRAMNLPVEAQHHRDRVFGHGMR